MMDNGHNNVGEVARETLHPDGLNLDDARVRPVPLNKVKEHHELQEV
jgi:hypothetical protein